MPLVLSQLVPNPRNPSVPQVRRYRDLYAQLYDDSPSPAGLAAEVRRRPDADIEGHVLRFGNGRQRGSRCVTQTMITKDGRLIG